MVQPALILANQRFSISGNEYVCRAIQRRQIEDFVAPTPSTGRQSGDTRFLRNNLIFGNVLDAYGGRTLGPWSLSNVIQDHLSHGHIHHFHDSEAETRFGAWTAPRQRNTLTLPSHVDAVTLYSEAILGLAKGGNVAGSLQQYNDQPIVYYAGSSVSGLFVHEAVVGLNSVPANTWSVESFAWTGAGFSAASTPFTISTAGDYGGIYDQKVHKGTLFVVGTQRRATV